MEKTMGHDINMPKSFGAIRTSYVSISSRTSGRFSDNACAGLLVGSPWKL